MGRTKKAESPALAAGLHVGVIELRVDGCYKVRLHSAAPTGGALVDATLSAMCQPELADECLRDRRVVLLSHDGTASSIIGALQTHASAATMDGDGQVEVRAERIELDASKGIALRVGDTEIALSPDGSLRLAGQRLTMDIAALVKVLASRVELP